MMRKDLVNDVAHVLGVYDPSKMQQVREAIDVVEAGSELLQLLKWAVTRISHHSDGCRGGEFARCRCSNAVTVRRLDSQIKKRDRNYVTSIEALERAEVDEVLRLARKA